jgi:hypothetical protein
VHCSQREKVRETYESVGDGRSASGFARRRLRRAWSSFRRPSSAARESIRRCNTASSSSTAAARGGVGVVGVEARAEGPNGGGGGTTTPARAPPPENVRRRAGLGERREIGVDARLAGLGDRRETDVGVDARRRRAAASAAPVAWRAIGDGDRAPRAAARGGEKKKQSPPRPPRGDAFLTSATASRTADFISRRSPLLSRDRGDRGEVRRCGDRSWASLRSASSSVEQRRSS